VNERNDLSFFIKALSQFKRAKDESVVMAFRILFIKEGATEKLILLILQPLSLRLEAEFQCAIHAKKKMFNYTRVYSLFSLSEAG